ncbi:flavin reductase family protein [Nocardia tengchongensis]|uniref:flavin reductase family protein n=1 Tax=Nocardia tengchongensis TaxID=2055889 RepID=UPI0036C39A2D
MTGNSVGTVSVSDTVAPQALREVLGHFASGIVVITANGPDGPVGFTCQSFASLSLDPPLITFSPARTSTTWPRIREIGTFCINVLAEDHEHHSAGFARSGEDKFADVHWTQTPSGAPRLPGVSAWIDCELWQEYDGGDHTIVVGRVQSLGADPDRLPLLFYRGDYAVTAPVDRSFQ